MRLSESAIIAEFGRGLPAACGNISMNTPPGIDGSESAGASYLALVELGR